MKKRITEEKTYFYNVPESEALVAEDYPWGYKLRTQQRYWIDTNKRGEQRFVYQTKNPKTGRWCAPKKSTYNEIVYLVQLHENGHYKHGGLSKYASVEEMEKFLSEHGGYLETDQVKRLETIIEGKKLVNKAFKDAQEHAITKINSDRPELNLSEKLFWTKQEIIKSPSNIKLLAIDVSGNAIKKRCRKADHYYKRIGFIENKTISESELDDLKMLAMEHCKENLREYAGMRLIIKETEFQAPDKNSPMFYGFKEMLMSGNKLVVNL